MCLSMCCRAVAAGPNEDHTSCMSGKSIKPCPAIYQDGCTLRHKLLPITTGTTNQCQSAPVDTLCKPPLLTGWQATVLRVLVRRSDRAHKAMRGYSIIWGDDMYRSTQQAPSKHPPMSHDVQDPLASHVRMHGKYRAPVEVSPHTLLPRQAPQAIGMILPSTDAPSHTKRVRIDKRHLSIKR